MHVMVMVGCGSEGAKTCSQINCCSPVRLLLLLNEVVYQIHKIVYGLLAQDFLRKLLYI